MGDQSKDLSRHITWVRGPGCTTATTDWRRRTPDVLVVNRRDQDVRANMETENEPLTSAFASGA